MSNIQVLKRSVIIPVGKYASEECTTDYGLPEQWLGAKAVDEQIGILSDLLKTNPNAKTKKFLREGLPPWFNQEWPEWIDGFFVCLNPLVNYYANLSKKIIPALANKFVERDWNFMNHRDGQLGDDRLRLNKQTISAYKKMAEVQKGNFWVIPMSLANGKRYPGKTCSSRRYLELAGKDEFGIGPSEGLCATLTHFNERVWSGKVFRMYFPGAKYDYPDDSERWSGVSYLGWDDGGDARFYAFCASGCGPCYASVLGLLSQH